METTLHPKIKELQLRSRSIGNTYEPEWVTDSLLVERLEEHCTEIRAARKLAENQVLACFCVWGVRDSKGTTWVRGAFKKSIADRGPKSNANQKIFVTWMHNLMDPIGRNVEMWEDDFGAFAVMEFDDPEAVPNAKRAMSQIRSKTINGYSFGFDYIYTKEALEYHQPTDSVMVKDVILMETCPMSIPSMKETHTVRGQVDYEGRKLMLDEGIQDFLKALPKTKQLELRQLLTEHETLSQFRPEAIPPIEESQDVVKVGELEINVTKL